jgi:hypothetical protein
MVIPLAMFMVGSVLIYSAVKNASPKDTFIALVQGKPVVSRDTFSGGGGGGAGGGGSVVNKNKPTDPSTGQTLSV